MSMTRKFAIFMPTSRRGHFAKISPTYGTFGRAMKRAEWAAVHAAKHNRGMNEYTVCEITPVVTVSASIVGKAVAV